MRRYSFRAGAGEGDEEGRAAVFASEPSGELLSERNGACALSAKGLVGLFAAGELDAIDECSSDDRWLDCRERRFFEKGFQSDSEKFDSPD